MVTNNLSKRILLIRKDPLFEFYIVMNILTLRVLSLSNSIIHTHHPQENNSEAEPKLPSEDSEAEDESSSGNRV